VPVRLALILGVALVYTLVAIVRSLFIRYRAEEPGRPLTRDEAPALWALTATVADRLGTRPVDAIFVTPGAEIAVTERGGLLKELRGKGQRCLIVGLGALPGMTVGQFQAILAHEYGHFSNRDTAGGQMVRQVMISLHNLAYGLAASGQATRINPVWLFVDGFHRIFLRITLGASRLQEILADRYAVLAYGVTDFTAGLTHVVRQGLTFDLQVQQEVGSAHHQRRRLQNLYALPPVPEGRQSVLETRLDEALTRTTSPYDSHPAIKDRLRLVSALDAASQDTGGAEPAWALLGNPELLQQEMTKQVQENIKKANQP
jgi:Zn-dependent protease with chaperone function